MGSTATLSSMRAQAIELADQTNSDFISTTAWGFYINAEAAALYRKLVQADPDRYIRRNPAYVFPLLTGYVQYTGANYPAKSFVAGETVTGGTSGKTATVIAAPDQGVGLAAGTLYIGSPSGAFTVGETITGGTSAATAVLSTVYQAPSQFNPLPSDSWLVNRVDYIQTLIAPLVFQTILAVNQMEEDSYQFTTCSFYGQGLRYRLQNSFVCFIPAPTVTGSIQLLYTPAYKNLVADSDSLDDLSGYADNVICGAAIRALKKENNFQHAAALQELKTELDMEFERIAQATRDKSTPTVTASLRNKMNGRGGGYRSW